MSDKVSEFYEDKKNVDEMQNWNSTLKEWETNNDREKPANNSQ